MHLKEALKPLGFKPLLRKEAMLADGEHRNPLLDQTHVVELEYKIGIELISLATIGVIGVGISHSRTFGMTILDGDKEV